MPKSTEEEIQSETKINKDFVESVFKSWQELEESNDPKLDFKSCENISQELLDRRYTI